MNFHNKVVFLVTISELSGAWSGDPTIITIFKAIDQERHDYFALSTHYCLRHLSVACLPQAESIGEAYGCRLHRTISV